MATTPACPVHGTQMKICDSWHKQKNWEGLLMDSLHDLGYTDDEVDELIK
jgi:hypothetical protein